MRQEYHKVESQDAKYEALNQETVTLINKGLSRDVTRELLRQQTSQASIMQVQVPKDQQESLAKTLEKLVDNPESVYVTDVTGKHIIVHKGITHGDLAELVCKRGYRLHITPTNLSMCEAATELAESAHGSVLVPGKNAITHGGVASMLQQAVAEGDAEKLQQTVNLLLTGKHNGSNLSPSAFGFIASVTGNAESLALEVNAELRDAVQLSWFEHDEIMARWDEVKRIRMAEQFKEEFGNNQMIEIIPEVAPSVPKKNQRMVIELEPEQKQMVREEGEEIELREGNKAVVQDELFFQFLTAKIDQMRASQLLGEAPDDLVRQQRYEEASRLVEKIDADGNVIHRMADEQSMRLFDATVMVAREAIAREDGLNGG